ncbi:MAG: 2'-5' RNA ligase family protein [Devosia sp.]
MALAVSLLFDGATTAAVEALWQRLAEAGISTSMLDLGYSPHVTLTVVQDETLADELQSKLQRRAWGGVLDVEIGPVGRFDGTDVVWLGCSGHRLRAMQRDVCSLVSHDDIEPHYRPESWIPHLTLQTSGDAAAGWALADHIWPTQTRAKATVVELVRFRPVVPLWRAEFRTTP